MKKQFGKMIMTGALVLGPLLSAGTAFAATGDTTKEAPVNRTSYNVQAFAFDGNSWKQLQGNNWEQIFKDVFAGFPGQADTPAPAPQPKPQPTPAPQPAPAPQPKPVQKPAPAPQPQQQPAPAGQNSSASQFEQQVLQLVNQERTKTGLNALSMDTNLSKVAMAKAQDMYKNNYFDHNSPTYGSPFDMMKSFGISFSTAGENIAKGQTSPQQVMNDWMNSAGHRANILNSSFTKIGIAQYNGEWVQEFIG